MYIPGCSFYLNILTNSPKGVRSEINKDINSIDVSKIHPHLDENTLLKELVAQFLAHEGYVETGKAFAEEVQTEDGTLRSGRGTSLENYAVEEDIDAGNRQRNFHSHYSGND